MPVEETNKQVNEKLKQKILEGEYTLGELIVPQTYEKITMVNNQLVTEEVSVSGRKIPLSEIRKTMLNEHTKYMKLQSDEKFDEMSREDIVKSLKEINEYKREYESVDVESLLDILKNMERRRNIMMWHDCATISNHSHFLVMASTMYDQAVHLTNEQYHQKFGQHVDVQATIEKPFLYIFGRCPSNDQQLLYSEERINDILKSKEAISTENGITVNDTVRVFKGDNPAAQLEARQQKGGNFFCFVCRLNAHLTKSYYHASSYPLQDKIDKIKCSHSTMIQMKTNNTNYFANLKKEDIKCELIDRKVKFNLDAPVKDLRDILTQGMHGIQRLSALMFSKPYLSLGDLNLLHYEILSNEPLHDLSNHSKNLYEEIPYHFEKSKKGDINQIISSSFKNKEAKNSASYRRKYPDGKKLSNETLPKSPCN